MSASTPPDRRDTSGALRRDVPSHRQTRRLNRRSRSMSTENEIAWLFELEVKPENRAALEALIPEMVEGTKKAEPGSRAYQIFASEGSINVYERYDNSNAAVEHMKVFGEKFAG